MIPSPFSDNVLRGCFRVGDSGRWKVDLEKDIDVVIESVKTKLEAVPIVLNLKTKTDLKGNKIYQPGDLETALILRATYQRLLLQYKVRQPNRDSILCGISEALSEGTPSIITRCDIKKFYESIDAEGIVKSIRDDTRTAPQIRKVLDAIYSPTGVPKNCVPRGLSISTILSELVIRDFDAEMRKTNGVHRYFRYADDILVFSLPELPMLERIRVRLKERDLELNDKTQEIIIASEEKNSPLFSQSATFSFLGYRFDASHGIAKGESRKFNVSIADHKLKKRQSRFILSLRAFSKDKDAHLLIDRLAYLCSNHSVYRTRHARGMQREKIRTGIYYNYPHCGAYASTRYGRVRNPHRAQELVELDGALQSLLFGGASSFAKIVNSLPADQQNRLRELSFFQGYAKRIMHRFSRQRVGQICRIWGNV
jgi:hypothetical protein